MSEELMREILAELKSVRKLLENGFGVQAESIQELGVVDRPATKIRLSISKNDGVMLEEEKDGRWGNSEIENICGRLSSLTTRISTEGEYKGTLYGYLEIQANQAYSIRFNTAKTFGRLLISSILSASYEQLSGIVTLSVSAGTKKKTVRLPDLIDSFGFKIEGGQIPEEDWAQNRASYLEQAAAKIKAARSNIPALGTGNNVQAIAPAQTSSTSPSEQSVLVQKVIAESKALWGDNFKDKIREHSATHFDGLYLKDMAAAQLQKYLEDLDEIKSQQKGAA